MKQLTQSLGRSLVYWTSFVAVALLASGVSQAAQDGWTGIVWRNSVSGNNTLWVMAGGAYSTAVPLRSEPDLNWDIVGTGDMDGDGHFDLVFRHGSTGATRIWYMNDANYVGTAVICGESNLDWKIVAVADFDGDGKSDLLWRDVTVSGANAIWYMDGARVVSTAYIQTQADLNWRIVAASDFDSDNHPDIVWRHAGSGQNAVWHMNNATYLGAAVLEPESRLGHRGRRRHQSRGRRGHRLAGSGGRRPHLVHGRRHARLVRRHRRAGQHPLEDRWGRLPGLRSIAFHR